MSDLLNAEPRLRELTDQLRRWDRRRRLRDALMWVPRGLLAGLLLAALVAAAAWLRPLLDPRQLLWVALGLAGAGLLGGLLLVVWRRADVLAQARFADGSLACRSGPRRRSKWRPAGCPPPPPWPACS